MQVILLERVAKLGQMGEVVKVKEGFARNYLLPRKLAQEATADNINTMKMNDKATLERQAKERAEALAFAQQMRELKLKVTAKGGGAGRLFGSVTNVEIAEALERQTGIKLDKRKIFLDEPIKTTGVYTAHCKLGYEVTAALSVEVAEA